jgi:A/G-specific adenine glycosylase
MLQQTQTERVEPKYQEFLHRFPDFETLAKAPAGAVLTAWQGLGYNRRALALQRCAREVISQHEGALPEDPTALVELPGIGPYTAGAVAVFAFDRSAVFIETNIRTVFIHFFFPKRRRVRDSEIVPLVARTLPRRDVRRWYYALMDYGVMLKRTHPQISRRSAHYNPQPPFQGSRRQIRGGVLRLIARGGGCSRVEIENGVRCPRGVLDEVLKELCREGFITSSGGAYRFAEA